MPSSKFDAHVRTIEHALSCRNLSDGEESIQLICNNVELARYVASSKLDSLDLTLKQKSLCSYGQVWDPRAPLFVYVGCHGSVVLRQCDLA